MLIYKITNKLDGFAYIGQTINTFERRYDCGKWWKHTSNDHLMRAVNKYGIENFKVEFLAEGVNSEEELDRLEVEFIKTHNTLHPNGYNFQPGGSGYGSRKHCKKSRDQIAFTHSGGKTNKLKNQKTGKIYEFINITEFCREHNLENRPLIVHVLHGKRKKHGFWTLPETVLKTYTLFSPSGEKFELLEGEVKGFCRDQGITSGGIFKLCAGEFSQYLGWTSIEKNEN
jgi:group I intron endonuclease